MLQKAVRTAGFPELASGCHSLRLGGETAYANADNGGEMIAGFMGAWSSEARRLYLWACTARLDMVSVSVARNGGLELAGRPGPLGTSNP